MTPRQRQLLDFIAERIQTVGVSPSFDEMKAHLGLASKSGVHRILTALEERGRIRRLPNRARAIEVVQTIPVDLQTYRNACDRAREAGLSLSQYAAICINSHEARQ